MDAVTFRSPRSPPHKGGHGHAVLPSTDFETTLLPGEVPIDTGGMIRWRSSSARGAYVS